MAKIGRTLWQAIPAATRLELVPIVTTAILVENGKATAEWLTRLHDNKSVAGKPSQAAIDLTGACLLLNFVVILGFGYAALRHAVAKGGDITLNAQLVGFAAIFLTCSKTYGYALESGQPERLTFLLPVLFYMFCVPFFLVRSISSPQAGADVVRPRLRAAWHATAALELCFYALVPFMAAALAVTVCFVVINQAPILPGASGGTTIISQLRGPFDKPAYWGFNPAYVGLGWLPAVLIVARSRSTGRGNGAIGVAGAARWWLVVAAAAINAALAVALIGDGAFGSTTGIWSQRAAKAVLAVTVTVAFLSAFAVARWAKRAEIRTVWRGVCELLAFAMAGSAVGGLLLALRAAFEVTTPHPAIFLGLHTASFVLSYAAGRLALRPLARRIRGIDPVL